RARSLHLAAPLEGRPPTPGGEARRTRSVAERVAVRDDPGLLYPAHAPAHGPLLVRLVAGRSASHPRARAGFDRSARHPREREGGHRPHAPARSAPSLL